MERIWYSCWAGLDHFIEKERIDSMAMEQEKFLKTQASFQRNQHRNDSSEKRFFYHTLSSLRYRKTAESMTRDRMTRRGLSEDIIDCTM